MQERLSVNYTDIALIAAYVVNAVTLGLLVYNNEMFRRERKDLLRMIKARDLDEVVRAEKTEKKEEVEEIEPDYKSTELVTDDEFMEAVSKG